MNAPLKNPAKKYQVVQNAPNEALLTDNASGRTFLINYAVNAEVVHELDGDGQQWPVGIDVTFVEVKRLRELQRGGHVDIDVNAPARADQIENLKSIIRFFVETFLLDAA